MTKAKAKAIAALDEVKCSPLNYNSASSTYTGASTVTTATSSDWSLWVNDPEIIKEEMKTVKKQWHSDGLSEGQSVGFRGYFPTIPANVDEIYPNLELEVSRPPTSEELLAESLEEIDIKCDEEIDQIWSDYHDRRERRKSIVARQHQELNKDDHKNNYGLRVVTVIAMLSSISAMVGSAIYFLI